MLPPDQGGCKSEFLALADTGSVKSQAKPGPHDAEGERRPHPGVRGVLRGALGARRGRRGPRHEGRGPAAKPQMTRQATRQTTRPMGLVAQTRIEEPRKKLHGARGERSVNVSLTARVVGDTGIEPVTSSV